MSDPYEEFLEGDLCLRFALTERHEEICRRLHTRIAANLAGVTTARLLPQRSMITLSPGNKVRPDLALTTTANNKLWLVAEVIGAEDHGTDTVIKKTLYEDVRVPRVWMVDPRYNNVEVYHGTEQGMILKHILAIQDVLTEPLLPAFQYVMSDLFQV